VWDPGGKAAPVVLAGHKGRVTALAALPDGRLASGSGEKVVRTWEILSIPQALVDLAMRRAPRCLTPEERVAVFLPAEPPNWCRTTGRYPYDAGGLLTGAVTRGKVETLKAALAAATTFGRSDIATHGARQFVDALLKVGNEHLSARRWSSVLETAEHVLSAAELAVTDGARLKARALLLRAEARERMGETAAAKADLEEAERLVLDVAAQIDKPRKKTGK
jgi:hypothetical protein